MQKRFLGNGKKDARVSIEPINVEEPVIAAETNKKSTEEEQTFAEEKTEEKIQQAVESSSSDIQLIDLDEEEAIKELALYLTNITNDMGVPALVKIQHEANGLIVMNLETSKQGMLIGKHGKILNALQYLAQVFYIV